MGVTGQEDDKLVQTELVLQPSVFDALSYALGLYLSGSWLSMLLVSVLNFQTMASCLQ